MEGYGTPITRMKILVTLLKAELSQGILGLRLFMACVAVAAGMLGVVWLMGAGLSEAMQDNARRILGGDVAVTVVNAPLDFVTLEALGRIGRMSNVVELRSTAQAGSSPGSQRLTIELKAVDDAYPLYGAVALEGGGALSDALAVRDGLAGAVVEPDVLVRLNLAIGDVLRIGDVRFQIRDRMTREPDRLSAGTFLVGPRVLVPLKALEATGLAERGSLVEYRTRVRFPEDTTVEQAMRAVADLEPGRGWEIQSPDQAAERVREVMDRTTTFLGVAGLAAFAVGLTGAWAAVSMWIGRRRRTIAQYRLSGATTATVVALHAVLVSVAGTLALILGIGLAIAGAGVLLGILTERLHLIWSPADMASSVVLVTLALALGLTGASVAALSGFANFSPLRAMRDEASGTSIEPRNAIAAGACVIAAAGLAVLGLPNPAMATLAVTGLALVAGMLLLLGAGIAYAGRHLPARGLLALTVKHGLTSPGPVMLRTLALGIGITGITGVVATQQSLQTAFETQIPKKAPDLVLLDVQPSQVERIRATVSEAPALHGLQATPFMRTRILAVNGVPAAQALVNPEKDWVIEGDRSFSWSAEPTGAELVAGEWWPADYDGPPLVSAEEDVMQAFDLKPGDTLRYSVLGRVFTSKVMNIRKEYHRTLRPEFLVVASPQPFQNAPHGWIVSLQVQDTESLNKFVGDLTRSAPNVTVIDVRRLVRDAAEVVESAILGTLLIAAVLLLLGALSLSATIVADVDARRREAVALAVVGATRREIALARLAETAMTGLVAALAGGAAGMVASFLITTGALRVDWTPGLTAFLLPIGLGVIMSIAAGLSGGLGALPRGRGQLMRLLAG